MFFDDDIPVWGFVGKVAPDAKLAHTKAAAASKRYYLFTHFHFDISYNKDHVIELNVSTVSSDPRMTVDITGGGDKGGQGYRRKWLVADDCLCCAVTGCCLCCFWSSLATMGEPAASAWVLTCLTRLMCAWWLQRATARQWSSATASNGSPRMWSWRTGWIATRSTAPSRSTWRCGPQLADCAGQTDGVQGIPAPLQRGLHNAGAEGTRAETQWW